MPTVRDSGDVDETFTRRELLARGWTIREIARQANLGILVRVRRGHFARPDIDDPTRLAVQVGGRLGCVSELRHRGIWVVEPAEVHVNVAANAARLRDPSSRRCVVHWSVLLDPDGATASHVSVVDALVNAIGCLHPWFAIAAIDSALNRGEVSMATLQSHFARAPARLTDMLDRVDPDSQSGLESIVRLLAVALGFDVRSQVRFRGIGIVDLLIEGWIVVETDGSEHHDTAVVAAADRRRDAQHAATGRTALRFRYAQVVHDLPSVAAAIIGAVAQHRRIRNSGELARIAMKRLERLQIS